MYGILKSIYENVKSCVLTDTEGNTTLPFDCSMGVRQGCQLSPFLFTLFVNDLEHELSSSSHVSGVNIGMLNLYMLLFADDLALFSLTAIDMQRTIKELEKYRRAGQVGTLETITLSPAFIKQAMEMTVWLPTIRHSFL